MTQTKTQQTPGPLSVFDNGGNFNGPHAIGVSRDTGDGMADVAYMEMHNRDRETTLAYAQLFAAAPEMLEALQRALDSGQLRGCLVERVVHAAIAKATYPKGGILSLKVKAEGSDQ